MKAGTSLQIKRLMVKTYAYKHVCYRCKIKILYKICITLQKDFVTRLKAKINFPLNIQLKLYSKSENNLLIII